jgi:hypothetical protein
MSRLQVPDPGNRVGQNGMGRPEGRQFVNFGDDATGVAN